MNPSRALLLILVGLNLAASSCGDVRDVYSEQEKAALDRFEALVVGSPESAVRASLGAPTCVVRFSGDVLVSRCPENAQPQSFPRSTPSDWPWQIRALPKGTVSASHVLIYVDGTVYGHYFIDDTGKVSQVSIWVS